MHADHSPLRGVAVNGDTASLWKFFRIGGLDQVTLQSAEELSRLDELDPKLWVVLSCPSYGLRFDQRTLDLLDTDRDGRIHIPEILSALRWTVERLKDPAGLARRADALPLADIRSDTGQGRLLLASAERVLRDLGKSGLSALSREDVGEARRQVLGKVRNGDGVISAHPDLPEDLRNYVTRIMGVAGSVPGADAVPGVDRELVRMFRDKAGRFRAWLAEAEALERAMDPGPDSGSDSGPDPGPGSATDPDWDLGSSYALLLELAPKIDDYFLRCRLADFDPRAEDAVNAPREELARLGSLPLMRDDEPGLAQLPLAWAAAGSPLPLWPESKGQSWRVEARTGLNPAWSGRLALFARHVARLLPGDRDSLDEAGWQSLRARFAEYAALMARKPEAPVTDWSPEELDAALEGDLPQRLEELFQQDELAAPEIAAMEDVEKLVLFHSHLHRLLMNFVSFCDFYDQGGDDSTFQIGSLYMDGRCCRLCLWVEDIDGHAAAAQSSALCLAYCACVRQDGQGGRGEEKRNIVAAVTAGDSQFLTPGRNGVFVDREGVVWDAALVRLVDNPISIRAAMFAPYRRFGRMLSELVEKFTAGKESQVGAMSANLASRLISAPNLDPAPPAPAPVSAAASPAASLGASLGASPARAPFDIGKSAGILAALGLALGALGTALATIVSSLLALSWWQFPLLLAAAFFCVSGPSMFLAWLKLRKRTLGPLLDASGWAVNSRIPINLTLGGSLTSAALTPPGARRRTKEDPLRPAKPWKRALAVFLTVAVVLALGFLVWWQAEKLIY